MEGQKLTREIDSLVDTRVRILSVKPIKEYSAGTKDPIQVS